MKCSKHGIWRYCQTEVNLNNITACSFHFTYLFPRPSLMFRTQCCKNYIIWMSSSLGGSSPQYGWNSGCKSTAHTAPVLCLQSKRELLTITGLWRPQSLGKLAEIVVLWLFFRQMSTWGWDGNPVSRIWWNSQLQRTDIASDSFSSV